MFFEVNKTGSILPNKSILFKKAPRSFAKVFFFFFQKTMRLNKKRSSFAIFFLGELILVSETIDNEGTWR